MTNAFALCIALVVLDIHDALCYNPIMMQCVMMDCGAGCQFSAHKEVHTMAKVEVVVNEPAEEEARKPLLEAVRKVVLASVGAVALAQDAAEDLVNKLVERGEIAEEDGRKRVGERRERRKKQAGAGAGRASEVVDRRVQDVMDRMNVPTKADIDALSAKITALSEKVDELNK